MQKFSLIICCDDQYDPKLIPDTNYFIFCCHNKDIDSDIDKEIENIDMYLTISSLLFDMRNRI